MSNQIQLCERTSYSYCARSWCQQTNPSRILYSIRQYSSFTRMNSPVSFLTNLRQDHLQHGEMFSWNKIINMLKSSRGNINPSTTFKPLGWKCYKTIGSYISVRSSRYEARRKFGEHERCVRVALGIAKSNSSFLSALQTSQVLHILMNAQLTYEPIVNLLITFFNHQAKEPVLPFIAIVDGKKAKIH